MVQRRFTLLRRAVATGLMDAVPEFGPGSARARAFTQAEVARRLAAQNAIRDIAARRPGRVTTERGLAQQEKVLDTAEKNARPELDRLADLAFERHSQRLKDAGVCSIRCAPVNSQTSPTGRLAKPLLNCPGAQGLNEAQLRGVLYAAYGSPGEFIDIRALFDVAGSAAERNAALDFFSRLMDQSIPGTYKVLRTMATNRNNWRGGIHVLDFALNGTGGTPVAVFEFPEALSESGGCLRRRPDL